MNRASAQEKLHTIKEFMPFKALMEAYVAGKKSSISRTSP